MHVKQLMPVVMLSLILTGCASLERATGLGTLTASAEPKKGAAPEKPLSAACLALDYIKPSRGKPGGPSTEDIAAALDQPMPVARVRNLVGDTSQTLAQIDKNNAALKALCE